MPLTLRDSFITIQDSPIALAGELDHLSRSRVEILAKAPTSSELSPNNENVIRAATAAPDTQPNNENDALDPATLTPYERMRQLLAARSDRTDTVVMDTVEGLNARLQEQEESGSGVVAGVIRMRLFWVSDHTYKQWNLVRLHICGCQCARKSRGST
ncbi:hypothetical protein PHYPSEUDO_014548 [Phytophthora pseudosyringae]|uniref:Uncharacterized protein n=1 Tax=Phytophthora pseudosyringae TaxID=221518 RepID=A0A8T1W0F2_9STRA|nr:hypothetical protein PHYPSEUDO_014548 [Phytophthora pseudosyringae]